jgi:hypothetical protein
MVLNQKKKRKKERDQGMNESVGDMKHSKRHNHTKQRIKTDAGSGL